MTREQREANRAYISGLERGRAALLIKALNRLGEQVRRYNYHYKNPAQSISWRKLTVDKTRYMAYMMDGCEWYDGRELDVWVELMEYFSYLNKRFGWKKEIVLGNICRAWGILPWYTREAETLLQEIKHQN